MSTEGCGKAGIAIASPIIAGVGIGILIGQGIMWCGDAMEAYIEEKEQEYIDRYNEAQKENFKVRDQLHSRDFTDMRQNSNDDTPVEVELSLAEQETLLWSMSQARTALADVGNPRATAHNVERRALRAQLTFDLEFHRSFLSPELIDQAEYALNGSMSDLREAIAALLQARSDIEASQSQEVAAQRETAYNLQIVTNQLNTINVMLQEAGGSIQPAFLERQQTIQALISAAAAQSSANSSEALRLATEARLVAHDLSTMVSSFLFDAYDTIHSQVNTALGTLTTLRKMIEEAGLLEMADRANLAGLTQRISSAYNEAQIIGQSPSLDSARQLTRLAARIDLLKQDVFTVVETYQQHAIAETIATTLTELGFQSVTGVQSVLQDNGDVIHIAMAQKGSTPEGELDERLVSFDISRKGDVNYDFSGYTGETCLKEAIRVFNALRANGVYLLDPSIGADLPKKYPRGITARMLNQSEYLLQPEKNKLQTTLAERISTVLNRMQYDTIHQSAVGGSIELEAFNGSIGYHIILTPEGAMQVFKDTEQESYTDVTSDPSDPVVAGAQQTLEQQSERQALDTPETSNRSEKKAQNIQPRRQIRRMLEQ